MTTEEFKIAFREAFGAVVTSVNVDYSTHTQDILIMGNQGVHSVDRGLITANISVICAVDSVDKCHSANQFDIPSDVTRHMVTHIGYSALESGFPSVMVTITYVTSDVEQFLKDLKDLPYKRYCTSFTKQLEDKLD